ncbi:MAG: hypothetical protein IJW03_01045 [Clostridia bacterium]|nr:hypothetical protein [Clostridia bacterium]
MINVFVDEEHIITSQNFYGSHTEGATPNTAYTNATLLSLRAIETHVYLDNSKFIKEDLTFDPSVL